MVRTSFTSHPNLMIPAWSTWAECLISYTQSSIAFANASQATRHLVASLQKETFNDAHWYHDRGFLTKCTTQPYGSRIILKLTLTMIGHVSTRSCDSNIWSHLVFMPNSLRIINQKTFSKFLDSLFLSVHVWKWFPIPIPIAHYLRLNFVGHKQVQILRHNTTSRSDHF